MEINHHKFSSTWELEMAIEDQILHDQNKLPLGSTLWSNSYPLQDHHHHYHHHHHVSSSSLNQLPSSSDFSRQRGENHNNHQIQAEQERQDDQEEELGAMKEMMFKIAAMQPVDIDPSTIRKPKRRNVRISDDPQSVAARHRRERISEKIRILQRLVPGGTKMDTASMLEEAGRYIKFLKRQIKQLEDNHQPQCIGVMSNFPGAPNYNKPLGGSTGTFSMESVAQTTYTAAGHEHV